jgi:hypothetical protein
MRSSRLSARSLDATAKRKALHSDCLGHERQPPAHIPPTKVPTCCGLPIPAPSEWLEGRAEFPNQRKAKTPRISLIWKVLIREISEIRGVFIFADMKRRHLTRLYAGIMMNGCLQINATGINGASLIFQPAASARARRRRRAASAVSLSNCPR